MRLEVLTLTLALAVPAIGHGQITIDDFQEAQSGTGTLDTASVLGGERDIREVSTVSATVGMGVAHCVGPFLTSCVFVYDGDDSDPATDTKPGFPAVDFTAGGQDRLVISTVLTSGSCNLLVQFCDSVPNCDTEQGLISTGTATFDYSSFFGVDFTDITFVSVLLSPQSTPSECSMGPPATGPVIEPPLFADDFETGDTTKWSATVGSP